MTLATGETIRPAEPASTAFAEWKRPLAAAVVLAGLLTLVFWDFVSYQVQLAIAEQADYGHILVVPFIAGYFVYLNRQHLLAQPFKTTWVGLLPVIVGFAVYVFFAIGAWRHKNLQSIGVIMTIAGLAVLFLGWRSLRWLWFPLAYLLVFGQEISPRLMNIVTYKMQDITARGAHMLMQFGMEVDRSGNTLYIFDNGETKPLNIAEACSGMRMLMAFLALSVAMAYTGFKRYWQRTVLVLMAFPTAIFVNILRVVTLGILSLFNTGFAEGQFHSFIGLVWLVPAFMIFLGLMWVIRQIVIEENAPARPAAVKGKA